MGQFIARFAASRQGDGIYDSDNRSLNKKLEVMPKEAEVVRKIFSLYVELGSVGDLARALEEQGIKPKPRQLANGQRKAAEHYTVGPLAHMLKNRMYVGEVAYRGEVHKGEHPAIVDREVFGRVRPCLLSGASQEQSRGGIHRTF
jgi:site-specific DNA recombinase